MNAQIIGIYFYLLRMAYWCRIKREYRKAIYLVAEATSLRERWTF